MFPEEQAKDGREDMTELEELPIEFVEARLTPKIEICTAKKFEDPVEGYIPTGKALIERYKNSPETEKSCRTGPGGTRAELQGAREADSRSTCTRCRLHRK